MEIIYCKDCRWWEKHKGTVPAVGKCRLKPPIYAEDYRIGRWPLTEETDWCGEGETKE